jgi:small subunit ribosomal protein S20
MMKTKVKNAVKQARAATNGDETPAADALKKAMSTLHKASSKGVIHPRNAARRIARLSKHFYQATLTKASSGEPKAAAEGE